MKYPPVVQVLVAAVLAWILARYLPLTQFGGAFADYVMWLSVVVGVGSLATALNVFRIQKTTFDPLDPSKAQKLVVVGIYRITRNPMYVAMALLLVGWCLFLGDLVAFIALPSFVIAMNELQIKAEEHALLQKFGDDYAIYKQRVRRWL